MWSTERIRSEGRDFQVAINEIARNHALHGLASWLDFVLVDVPTPARTLTATIEPQGAYPWRVVVEVLFTLDAHGLTQTVTATNESAEAAPWGTGPHPYLVAGEGTVDDWTLTLPAAEVLAVTAGPPDPGGSRGRSRPTTRRGSTSARRAGSTPSRSTTPTRA